MYTHRTQNEHTKFEHSFSTGVAQTQLHSRRHNVPGENGLKYYIRLIMAVNSMAI